MEDLTNLESDSGSTKLHGLEADKHEYDEEEQLEAEERPELRVTAGRHVLNMNQGHGE